MTKADPKDSCRNETRWKIMFDRLVEYKSIHGDTCVPQRYKPDMRLGRWVDIQRRKCKDPERIEMLNDIGFKWKVRDNLEWTVGNWAQMLHRLWCYKQKHGHVLVPHHCQEDPSLGIWVQNQRRHCKLKHRIDLLNSIGFQWKVRASRKKEGNDDRSSGSSSPVCVLEDEKDRERLTSYLKKASANQTNSIGPSSCRSINMQELSQFTSLEKASAIDTYNNMNNMNRSLSSSRNRFDMQELNQFVSLAEHVAKEVLERRRNRNVQELNQFISLAVDVELAARDILKRKSHPNMQELNQFISVAENVARDVLERKGNTAINAHTQLSTYMKCAE